MALSTYSAGSIGFDGLLVIKPDGRVAIQSGIGNLGTESVFDVHRVAAELIGVPWEQWSMYVSNGSHLKKGDSVLGATLVAIGVMFSAMTSNQVVAAILAIGLSFLMWTLDSLAQLLPSGLERVFISLSLLARFTPFATGAMYVSDFGFFITVTALALFVAVRSLARR